MKTVMSDRVVRRMATTLQTTMRPCCAKAGRFSFRIAFVAKKLIKNNFVTLLQWKSAEIKV